MIYANFDVIRFKNIKICNVIKIYMIFANVVIIRFKICDVIKIHIIFANVVIVRFKNIKICNTVKIHVIFANVIVVRSQLLIHILFSKLQMYLIYFWVRICINNHQNLLLYESITFSNSAFSNVSSHSVIVYHLISHIKAFW